MDTQECVHPVHDWKPANGNGGGYFENGSAVGGSFGGDGGGKNCRGSSGRCGCGDNSSDTGDLSCGVIICFEKYL